MSRRQKNVGIIGLGIIGSRIADHVRRRGFHVFVWNRTPRPFPNFVGSRSELAELCDFIQIFVSDDDALLESIEQLKRSLKAHHVVMAHSTVAPHTMRAAAEIVQRRGAQLLDVPFTGSKLAAEKGELVYYVGGDKATLQRARPILQASSKEIIEMGDIGHATTVKLATNLITATTVQATAEGMALVARAGLSPEMFAEAMRGNASQSPTLAMKLPKMLSGDFEPHFSIKHMLKDLQIASRLARSQGLDLGVAEAARASLRREAEEGRGELDYSAVVHAYFPDGVPLRQQSEAETAEHQQTLGGLEELPTTEMPNPQERNGDSLKPEDAADTEDADDDIATASTANAEREEEDGSSEVPAAAVAAEEPLDEPRAHGGDAAASDAELERNDTPVEAEAISRVGSETGAPAADEKLQTNGESEPRRSFFNRIFGKAGDY